VGGPHEAKDRARNDHAPTIAPSRRSAS
jgi:hypothetical protein